jgi:hypothetical protein
MKIYFATNRDPNKPDAPTNFGTRFSASCLTDLRFGSAEITGSKFDKYVLDVALGRGLQKLASFLSGTRPEVSSIPICGIEPTSAQGAVRRKGRSIAAQSAVNNLRMRRMRPTISA